jgi:uncharacterized protein (DUF58 family)
MMPTPRLLAALGVLIALALAASLWPGLGPAWWAALAALGLLALIDALRVLRPPALTLERALPDSLALGAWREVPLHVASDAHRPLRLEVYDHHPDSMQAEGLPQRLTLRPGTHAELRYRLRPCQRGPAAFDRIQLRCASPLGLWRRNLRLPLSGQTRVYPNFALVAHYALLALDHRLSMIGILKRRRRGEGQDFHQLREYRPGDALRQIDWKATSRMRKPISREYQDERDQEIVFLLDCGHRMTAQDDDLSHFDHTLNALLLLGHVALRQGDAVGLATFGGTQRRLKPGKGPLGMTRLLNALYDLQPSVQAPDYLQAASELLAHQRKRALVVLVTNLRDEDATELLPAIALLRRRHLVLVASLREAAIDDALDAPVQVLRDALRVGAVHDYAAHRQQVLERVLATGALALDVTPERLPVNLVNRYLDIKRSGRL